MKKLMISLTSHLQLVNLLSFLVLAGTALSVQAADSILRIENSMIPLTANDWSVAYTGYGFVNFGSQNQFVRFAPQASVASHETHAGLLLAKKHLKTPIKNFRFSVTVTTEKQLRTPKPNAWECFWLFFNYASDLHGKKVTNYFTLKPNGIELGHAYEELGQDFLATAAQPRLVIGAKNKIVIENKNGLLKAWVNDVQVLTFNSEQAKYPLYSNSGTIGLYSEDSQVKVESVDIVKL